MTIVTIKDVATRAGVSPKTVSRVINGEPHVRGEVRDAVKRVVAELDYRPNAFARSLSSSRSYLLGLFLDDPSSGYAADVQLGALMRCRERSYHLVIEPLDLSIPGWPAQVESTLSALRLDGAILTPPLCDAGDLLDVFDRIGLSYVRISPRGDADRSPLIAMDDRAAAFEMTQYLLALGHRNIGFVKGDPHHSVSAKRFDGFAAAMRSVSAEVAAAHVLEGDFSFRSGLKCGEGMLTAGEIPTAVFASNDDMAVGILMTAIKHGIDVPRDVSVVGFDDAPIARAAWPPLTTIRQPKAEMAAAAVDVLIDIGHRSAFVGEREQLLLAYELVIRASASELQKL